MAGPPLAPLPPSSSQARITRGPRLRAFAGTFLLSVTGLCAAVVVADSAVPSTSVERPLSRPASGSEATTAQSGDSTPSTITFARNDVGSAAHGGHRPSSSSTQALHAVRSWVDEVESGFSRVARATRDAAFAAVSRVAVWRSSGRSLELPETKRNSRQFDLFAVTSPLEAGDAPGQASPSSGEPYPSKEGMSQGDLVRLNVDLAGVSTSSATYSRFKSWVDAAVNGNPGYDFHPADAAIMFLITRDTRYCNTGVALVEEQVADAEASIASGSAPDVAHDSYLDVGPMIADLSYVYQACSAQMSASQRQRWSAYAEQAVWNIWNYQSARWGTRSMPWSGWSVDNPGNNYHFSFIEATMTWALASGSRTWFNLLANQKMPAIRAYYAKMPGGGSLEGTGYGVAQRRLFDLHRLWSTSTGTDFSQANTHAALSIPYWVHATVPTRDMFAPIGDQARSSSPDIFDYHRHLVLSARELTYDPALRDMASWWLRNISVSSMSQGSNRRYDALLPVGSANTPPADLHYVAKGTGHVFGRTGWDTNAMWMAFVAGPYNESHAHQDQGSFTLFSRGSWLAVTANIWSDSGINQDTPVHNVVRFERNGSIVSQRTSSTSTATVTPGSNGALTINANLTPAYGGNAAVGSWKRRLAFAGRKLNVQDTLVLGSGTSAYFQVNVPVQPTIVDARTIDAGGVRIRVLKPSNPTVTLHNWTSSGEFGRGWRVDIGGSATAYEVELTER